MTARANATPHDILDDAIRYAEMTLGNLLDDKPTLLLDDSPDVIEDAVKRLRTARAKAALKAKACEGDMGGTTLEMTLEEARTLRALLDLVATDLDRDIGIRHGDVYLTAAKARSLRKLVNHGVVRRCEARCTTTDETFRPIPAEAVSDSDDGETT